MTNFSESLRLVVTYFKNNFPSKIFSVSYSKIVQKINKVETDAKAIIRKKTRKTAKNNIKQYKYAQKY